MADETIVEIPIGKLHPDPANLRVADDGLAGTIRQDGIIEPLIVTTNGDGGYRIIAGHRRWAGARAARLKKVPCVVREYSDTDRRRIQLIENLHRLQLTPSQEARGFVALRDEFGMTQAQIAESVNVTQQQVSHRIALTKLPANVLELVDRRVIKLETARDLAKLADEPDLLVQALDEYRPDAPAGAWYSIESVCDRLVGELQKRKRYAKAARDAKAAGLTVVDNVPYEQGLLIHQRDDAPPCRLGEVARYRDVPDDHAQLDCHAVTIDLGRQSNHGDHLDQVCTDPSSHPLKERTARDLEERISTPRSAPTVDEDPDLARRLEERRLEEEQLALLARAQEARDAKAATIVAGVDDWSLEDGLGTHILRQLIDRVAGTMNSTEQRTVADLAGLSGSRRYGHEARTAIEQAADGADGRDLARLAAAAALVIGDPGTGRFLAAADGAPLRPRYRRHLQLLTDHGYRPCAPEQAALEATDG